MISFCESSDELNNVVQITDEFMEKFLIRPIKGFNVDEIKSHEETGTVRYTQRSSDALFNAGYDPALEKDDPASCVGRFANMHDPDQRRSRIEAA